MSRRPLEEVILFQEQEIARAKGRMTKACNARQMKPETMEYLLRNMNAVRNRLCDLKAVIEVFPDAAKIVAEPVHG